MSNTFYQGTRITAPPTFTGHAGYAWRLEMPPVGQRVKPDHDGTVDAVIVKVTGAHPLWDHWALSVIHLRPIEGVRPAHISRPGATHEVVFLALDPEHPLPVSESLIVGPSYRPHFLIPVDVAEQIVASDDAQAQQIFELAVRAIVTGVASPDADWRAWWRAALLDTETCLARGFHREGRA